MESQQNALIQASQETIATLGRLWDEMGVPAGERAEQVNALTSSVASVFANRVLEEEKLRDKVKQDITASLEAVYRYCTTLGDTVDMVRKAAAPLSDAHQNYSHPKFTTFLCCNVWRTFKSNFAVWNRYADGFFRDSCNPNL